MAKSDHGLPANSKATPRCISREEEELNWKYCYTKMTFREYARRFNELKRRGLIKR